MGGILTERIWEVKDKIRKKIGGVLKMKAPIPFEGKGPSSLQSGF
jgi:hypothetical protein